MKPMITREGNSATLDLTKPFLVWTALFVILGLLFDSSTLLTIAVLPWVFLVGFALAVFTFGALAMGIAYLSGQKIKVTNHKKGTVRYVQRKR